MGQTCSAGRLLEQPSTSDLAWIRKETFIKSNNIGPGPRSFQFACYLPSQDVIFTMGGADSEETYTNDVWMLNTESLRDKWMYAEPPFAIWGKIPRNKGWKAYALCNMSIYVFGGSDSGDLATIHQFEYERMFYRVVPTHGIKPKARVGYTVATVGDKIYFFGGMRSTALVPEPPSPVLGEGKEEPLKVDPDYGLSEEERAKKLAEKEKEESGAGVGGLTDAPTPTTETPSSAVDAPLLPTQDSATPTAAEVQEEEEPNEEEEDDDAREEFIYNEMFIYDTTTSRWSADPTLVGDRPTPRFGHSCCVIGKKLYFYGGAGGKVAGSENPMGRETFNDWLVFDTETNQWLNELSDLEAPLSDFQGRVWHTATAIGQDIYVFGGSSHEVADVDAVDRISLTHRSWERKKPSSTGAGGPAPRHAHTATLTKHGLVVIGGATADECLEDVWILAPYVKSSDRPIQMPSDMTHEADDLDQHIYASSKSEVA